MSALAIEARGLSKAFPGGVNAVEDLDFELRRGAVYGLMGRNGAGKTTALRLMLGLLRPDRGTARVLGHDFWTAPRAVRSQVAYVAQAQPLPGWMALRELDRLGRSSYSGWDAEYARDLSRRWHLAWERPVASLSAGEQRKAALILALAARPQVLVLDEPAAGLDPLARRALVDEVVELLAQEGECAIVLSTHITSDLERLAEYVGVMAHGRLVVSARLDELQRQMRRVQVVFTRGEPPAGFSIPGADHTQLSGPVASAIVRIQSEIELEPVRFLPGTRVDVFGLSLEEMFIELSARAERRGASAPSAPVETNPSEG
jgi:ABC-2 type transport system ATP-binding protein